MGRTMADETVMDDAEHERTYALFTGMVKWGTVSVAIVLIMMGLFLT